MGAITELLPVVLKAFEYAPKLIEGGRRVYEGAKAIWEGATAEEAPTPEQQQQYDDAERRALNAMLAASEDVAEEGDEKAE